MEYTNNKHIKKFNIEVDNKALVLAKESIIINANPSIVLTVLSDIESWHLWRSDIKYAKVMNEESQQEIKFKWKSNGITYHSTVHTHSDNLFGWTGRTLGAFAIHNWQLSSIKNGTKVEVSECLTGLTIKLLKKKMMKELPKMMG